ncbi:MAG: DoxX family protein [Kordiimonadaceae bacterium]|jgi:putative oxidoreductase|nr:DoxX family protein [Kordiimonadaceae bacterium]
MDNLLKKYEEHAYALLRMVTGFLLLFHGANYILGWPIDGRSWGGAAWYMAYFGVPILFLGGLFTCIGIFTRPAAFLASGMMAFAYWMAYGSKAFSPPADSTNSFIELMLPIVNKGELSVMFCLAFLYIATRGDGIWSVGAMRKK